MKLSIIVPVYKVEKYLDKCIKSILAQTFSDYELILVDDGSPDRCGEVCDEWAEKDARIRVIHKENGGLSDARNVGIDAAQGEYIGFVDSDDYIREDMFEVLAANMEKYEADISMCGYVDTYEDGRTLGRRETDDSTIYIWDRKEAIHQVLLGKLLSVHAYTKLYKRRLFETVRYPKGRISEDAYIIMDILDQVDKAVFTPRTEYYYMHRGDSINTSKYKPIDKTRIEAHEKNYKYIQENYPEYGTLAHDRYLGAVYFVAHKMVMSRHDKTETNELISILRKNTDSVKKSKYFSGKRKKLIQLMMKNAGLYRLVITRMKL